MYVEDAAKRNKNQDQMIKWGDVKRILIDSADIVIGKNPIKRRQKLIF